MGGALLVIIAVAALAGAVVLVAVASTMPEMRRDRILRTLAIFTGQPDGVHVRRQVSPLGQALLDLAERLGIMLSPPGDRDRLHRMLELAGNPVAWPVQRVVRLRPMAMMALALLMCGVGNTFKGQPGAIVGAIAGVALGYAMPLILIYNASIKRQEAIQRALPDVMDVLVIGVEAGLGLDSAMDQVARSTRGPISDELHRALQEMRLGVARSEALRDLAQRTTVRDLKRLVTALIQAGELGISVAPILREHAADQRVRRRQRAEEAAQMVPVKMLFPILFCMFPAIFVVIIGPAVIQLVKTFSNS
ncbi:type II secretion system F family protein [Actinoplanes derwentensis]|uniref:Tight adherence protein C n=1 Tax=Actinoplanes derwentensis TaxID=113562 RepID=A0A1H2BN54_9ACTN|nr:type II secretion system F family protein [Actinoplanes derwentensis]GID86897.1 type II secretion system protein [Actinoplanes derwentensis]SDT59643.1 tight adherence protein C [Actinoplanes derwentensis]